MNWLICSHTWYADLENTDMWLPNLLTQKYTQLPTSPPDSETADSLTPSLTHTHNVYALKHSNDYKNIYTRLDSTASTTPTAGTYNSASVHFGNSSSSTKHLILQLLLQLLLLLLWLNTCLTCHVKALNSKKQRWWNEEKIKWLNLSRQTEK